MSRAVLFKLAAGLVLAGTVTRAQAQERPFAPRMTCATLSGQVAQAGTLVIGTGPMTYERAVSDGRFCTIEETTAPLWTPTSDNPQCFVGYRCKDKFNEGVGKE